MSFHFLKNHCLTAIFAIGALSTPALAEGNSVWRYQDIQLTMEVQGDSRDFVVLSIPPNSAKRLGIAQGATFWQGRRSGNELIGEAIVYHPGCKPAFVPSRGSALPDKNKSIQLSFANLKWNADCTSQVDKTLAPAPLDFKLLSKDVKKQEED